MPHLNESVGGFTFFLRRQLAQFFRAQALYSIGRCSSEPHKEKEEEEEEAGIGRKMCTISNVVTHKTGGELAFKWGNIIYFSLYILLEAY